MVCFLVDGANATHCHTILNWCIFENWNAKRVNPEPVFKLWMTTVGEFLGIPACRCRKFGEEVSEAPDLTGLQRVCGGISESVCPYLSHSR